MWTMGTRYAMARMESGKENMLNRVWGTEKRLEMAFGIWSEKVYMWENAINMVHFICNVECDAWSMTAKHRTKRTETRCAKWSIEYEMWITDWVEWTMEYRKSVCIARRVGMLHCDGDEVCRTEGIEWSTRHGAAVLSSVKNVRESLVKRLRGTENTLCTMQYAVRWLGNRREGEIRWMDRDTQRLEYVALNMTIVRGMENGTENTMNGTWGIEDRIVEICVECGSRGQGEENGVSPWLIEHDVLTNTSIQKYGGREYSEALGNGGENRWVEQEVYSVQDAERVWKQGKQWRQMESRGELPSAWYSFSMPQSAYSILHSPCSIHHFCLTFAMSSDHTPTLDSTNSSFHTVMLWPCSTLYSPFSILHSPYCTLHNIILLACSLCSPLSSFYSSYVIF